MVAIAEERAAALGVRNITFSTGDAEHLDLPEGTFDAVLSRWGLMFLPNLVPALDGMRRQLKVGGRVAAAVWSTAANAHAVSLPSIIVGQQLQLPPPARERLAPLVWPMLACSHTPLYRLVSPTCRVRR